MTDKQPTTKFPCVLCNKHFQSDGGMICDHCRVLIDKPAKGHS